jgi:hypothetical protein
VADEDGAQRLAGAMFDEAVAVGQSARTVPDDAEADAVRRALRELGAAEGVRLRTARLDDTVVVARLDAAIWTDDTATMRAKLTPPA